MTEPNTSTLTHEDPEAILSIVEAFCEKHEIAPTTFGRLAVNDGKLVGRIAAGSRIEPGTARRVRNFMDKVDSGEIVVRGRPRRKKDQSRVEKMAELISQETSIRTPGSFAFHEQRQRFHVFANTTNESWVLADLVAEDFEQLSADLPCIRIFYSPMDNGIALTRCLRALHARFPDLPVLVVLKGRGLEDLRNTMGRLVDRLAEHPLSVFVVTNLHMFEALQLTKTTEDNPLDTVWRDTPLDGDISYDYQNQIASLYGDLSHEWLVHQGDHGQPVYAVPSVVVLYRNDHKDQLKAIIPQPRSGKDDAQIQYDYCVLNHPYLHTHTMKYRTEYVLRPVADSLAPGGMVKIIQSYGSDPAHEIIKGVWPDLSHPLVSRHDIISALRHSMGGDARNFNFSGLTDSRSLFRFDMHTLPVFEGENLGALSLSGAWNNAVYFAQVREDLAQKAMSESTHYLDVTEGVLREHGGLWFVNETFSIQRKTEGV